MTESILKVENLKKHFPVRRGMLLRSKAYVRAVDGVTFDLKSGRTFGIVGESGSGKSTLGRTIIRLHEPTSGEIAFRGKNFLHASGKEMRSIRKSLQMIFQDPFSSLDPRMTVGQIIAEPLRVHKIGTVKERTDKARELLQQVGLRPSQINRYPHEFSGGQRQRISIARSIALNPDLVIADEPVSALDVSIQAQILNLMQDLQEKLGLTYIMISHDLTVVEHFCEEIAVMYLGKVVEQAPRDELFRSPQHPYTQALINAIPKVGSGKSGKSRALQGEVPNPINPPSGCAFHPRCPYKMDICVKKTPELKSKASQHLAACWLNEPHPKEV